MFNICYHITICPKYRQPCLHRYEKMLIKLFNEKAVAIGCAIENIEIMPDHVHFFIKCFNNNISISKIIQYLKGYTSYKIRRIYPNIKHYKAFWSPSYYVESIGHISENTIKKYIDNQKINIKNNYKYKKLIKWILLRLFLVFFYAIYNILKINSTWKLTMPFIR